MGLSTKNALLGLVSMMAVATSFCLPAEAQNYYRGYVHRSKTQQVRSFFYRHPKIKATTIGAGVGTAAGAGVGLLTGRGVGRGALIGAGTGAGVGLVRSSRILAYHPIVKDTATGSLVGLGLGMAARRGHHSGLKGAAVGGAAGLGIGALRQFVR